MNSTPLPFRLAIGLFALAVLYSLLSIPAGADEPRKGAPAAPAEAGARSETQIFSLRYARAADMAGVLKGVFGDRSRTMLLTFGVDDRTNSVIAAGPAAALAEVQAVLNKLDAASKDAVSDLPGAPPRIFRLSHLEPNEALEGALQMVFRARNNGNFVVDRQRKLVIVSSDEATVRAVAALLNELDERDTSPAELDVQIRVAWVVNGPGTDDLPPPPDDLKEALASLTKLGIDHPRLAGQTLVSATANSSFQARGTAKLGSLCTIAIKGRFNDRKGTPALEIGIRATRDRDRAVDNICDLQTEISAPLGHMVVLGVTPTGALTSVFVVQVLRPEAKRPEVKRSAPRK